MLESLVVWYFVLTLHGGFGMTTTQLGPFNSVEQCEQARKAVYNKWASKCFKGIIVEQKEAK